VGADFHKILELGRLLIRDELIDFGNDLGHILDTVPNSAWHGGRMCCVECLALVGPYALLYNITIVLSVSNLSS